MIAKVGLGWAQPACRARSSPLHPICHCLGLFSQGRLEGKVWTRRKIGIKSEKARTSCHCRQVVLIWVHDTEMLITTQGQIFFFSQPVGIFKLSQFFSIWYQGRKLKYWKPSQILFLSFLLDHVVQSVFQFQMYFSSLFCFCLLEEVICHLLSAFPFPLPSRRHPLGSKCPHLWLCRLTTSLWTVGSSWCRGPQQSPFNCYYSTYVA